MATNFKRTNSNISDNNDNNNNKRLRENEECWIPYQTEAYLKMRNRRLSRIGSLAQMLIELDKYANEGDASYDPFNLRTSWMVSSESWFKSEMQLAKNAMVEGLQHVNSPKSLREQSKFVVYLFKLPIKSLPKTLQKEMRLEFVNMMEKMQEELEIINCSLAKSTIHYNTAVGANIACLMM